MKLLIFIFVLLKCFFINVCTQIIKTNSIELKCCLNSSCKSSNVTSYYKIKHVKIAMSFSIFLGPLGADWFYLSDGNKFYIILGLIKMLIAISFLSCFIYLRLYKNSFRYAQYRIEMETNEFNEINFKGPNEKFSNRLFNLVFLLGTLTICWNIIDVFRIPNGAFKDGNGCHLFRCDSLGL